MDSLLETFVQLLWRIASHFARMLVAIVLSQLFDRTAGRYLIWPLVEWCLVRPFWLAIEITCLLTRALTSVAVWLFPALTRPVRAMPVFADPRYDAIRQKPSRRIDREQKR